MSEEDVVTPEQLEADSKLRTQLEALISDGLQAEVEPRAYSHEEVLEVVTRLQKLNDDDYENKLIIGGFTLDPYVSEDDDEQACETCMYYRVHQKFCELPELMLPVEGEWSCRLWRI